MAAGPLNPETKRDILIIGSATSLQAYDLLENKDLFYKEIPDGVFSLLFAHVHPIPEPLVLVGENCSIQVRLCIPLSRASTIPERRSTGTCRAGW